MLLDCLIEVDVSFGDEILVFFAVLAILRGIVHEGGVSTGEVFAGRPTVCIDRNLPKEESDTITSMELELLGLNLDGPVVEFAVGAGRVRIK